jgi:hypothetical protein
MLRISLQRFAQHDKRGLLLLFPELDFLAEQLRIAHILPQERNDRGGVPGIFGDHFVVNIPQPQGLAVVRQFPNDVCVLAFARVEILHTDERHLSDIGMVSAKQVSIVINDVRAVIEPSQF